MKDAGTDAADGGQRSQRPHAEAGRAASCAGSWIEGRAREARERRRAQRRGLAENKSRGAQQGEGVGAKDGDTGCAGSAAAPDERMQLGVMETGTAPPGLGHGCRRPRSQSGRADGPLRRRRAMLRSVGPAASPRHWAQAGLGLSPRPPRRRRASHHNVGPAASRPVRPMETTADRAERDRCCRRGRAARRTTRKMRTRRPGREARECSAAEVRSRGT